MKLSVSFIDAFANNVFQGNPAAVILLDQWISESLMQSIAAENNVSETAFVVPIEKNGHAVFTIRWFSPLQEIPFCGHATLASSFYLFSRDSCARQLHFFAEAVGDFVVEKIKDGTIRMDFPNNKPKRMTVMPDALLQGLSIAPLEVYRNQQAYIVLYDEEKKVREVTTDDRVLAALAPYNVSVTAPSTQYDFVSRYFWPASGGSEDPVTGSIHTALAPLWAERLSKTRLLAYQASSRGGELLCEVEDDRVFVSGKAVLYLEGTIFIND